MTQVEEHLSKYSAQLEQLEQQIAQRRTALVQMTADANAVRGVVQYLEQQYRELMKAKEPHVSDTPQLDSPDSAGAVGGADSPVLD